MKLLTTTIAAVVLVGCGESVPDISILTAANKGNIEAVKQHLAAGTDVNANASNGTPLILACGNYHAFYSVSANTGSMGRTAIQLLLARGADVNAKTSLGWTALHEAAKKGHENAAELLISKGANANAIAVQSVNETKGDTPLGTAIQNGKHAVAKVLIPKTDNLDRCTRGRGPLTLMLNKATYGSVSQIIEVAELLIAKGADVNARDIFGDTALFLAVLRKYNLNIAELLIDKSADVNAKVDGMTPLHRAAKMDNKEIAELLIANGADLNARNNDDKTPLEVATGATATYLQGVNATAATDNSQNNQTGNQPTANQPTGRKPTSNQPTVNLSTGRRTTSNQPTVNLSTGRRTTSNQPTVQSTVNRSARTQSPILTVLDANKDGLLSSLELQKLISRQTGRPTPLYKTLDANRDGKLSPAELFGKP